MQLSLILLSTLAALAQSTFAARLPLDQPGSPRSSVQGATEAKAAYRRRQAQSADIVRRLKTGPNRKRQDPSAGACSISSGTNVVQNPGFESPNGLLPWTADKSSNDLLAAPIDSYGYQSSTGFVVQNNDRANAASVNLQQSVDVCAGAFNFAFDIGKAFNSGQEGAGCGRSTSFYQGRPCFAADECTETSNGEEFFKSYNFPNAITFTAAQAADPVLVQALFSCDPGNSVQGQGTSKVYVIDNVVLSKA